MGRGLCFHVLSHFLVHRALCPSFPLSSAFQPSLVSPQCTVFILFSCSLFYLIVLLQLPSLCNLEAPFLGIVFKGSRVHFRTLLFYVVPEANLRPVQAPA